MPASPVPRNQKLGLKPSEIKTLTAALNIARWYIATRPTAPTTAQDRLIDKLCDLRSAAETVVALETGNLP